MIELLPVESGGQSEVQQLVYRHDQVEVYLQIELLFYRQQFQESCSVYSVTSFSDSLLMDSLPFLSSTNFLSAFSWPFFVWNLQFFLYS